MKFPKPLTAAAHRRSFLAVKPRFAALGKSRIDALERRGSGTLLRASRTAMACRFEILLPAALRLQLPQAHQALDEVDRLESQMTVYRDDSEIGEINRNAGQRPVQVEEGLFRLLLLGARLSRETGGAFDMTAAPLTRCWGFFSREGRVPTDREIDAALERVGWQAVELDETRRTVRFRRPVELNLGAIGKGFALDRAAQILAARSKDAVGAALLHAGHSSVLAFGNQPRRTGWQVGIRHPLQGSRHCAVFRLRNQALSVSGVGEQNFLQGGRTFGHIIDPRTGRPAEGTLCAAVAAPLAAEADALSTAFFVMTPAEVAEFCRRRSDVGALIVSAGHAAGEIAVQSFNLNEDALEVLC